MSSSMCVARRSSLTTLTTPSIASPTVRSLDVRRDACNRSTLLRKTRLIASPTAPAGAPPAAARRFTAAADRCARSASPSGAMEPTRYHLWYAAYGGSTSCPSDGRGRFPRVAPPLRREPVAPAVDRGAPSVPAGVRPRRASPDCGAAVPPSVRPDASAFAGGFRRRADAVGGDHDRWVPPRIPPWTPRRSVATEPEAALPDAASGPDEDVASRASAATPARVAAGAWVTAVVVATATDGATATDAAMATDVATAIDAVTPTDVATRSTR